jgi:glycosyltransferase involved in cell wall biosynthesis
VIKVLYDHQVFSLQRYGGISRYFANLYHSYKQGGDIDPKLALLHSRNHYINEDRFAILPAAGNLLFRSDRKLYKANQFYSKWKLQKNSFDIFHPTYYDTYFLDKLKKPFVLTVHDMIYELFPQFFEKTDKYLLYKTEIIKRADHIIAISQSTKSDIQEFFSIPDEKISVVHHGFLNEANGGQHTVLPLEQPYVLFVGDRKTYKNFNRFAEALFPVMQKNKDLCLVCTGGGKFSTDENGLLEKYKMIDRCMQVSADNALLNQLYQKAELFVFPSLYEGFGFPLLEAFNAGCPVAASNTSCFKEVGGDAVLYFDPCNAEEMTATFDMLIRNKQLATNLAMTGKKQLQKFTMEKCAAETLAIYKKLI